MKIPELHAYFSFMYRASLSEKTFVRNYYAIGLKIKMIFSDNLSQMNG